MSDIDQATGCVVTYGHAVAAVKDGILLGVEDGAGVLPFIKLAERLGSGLRGASLADRVVGRAVALSCVALGVSAVHAVVASRGALDELERAGVAATAARVVPVILNRDGTGPCPTERLVAEVTEPVRALQELQRFVAERRREKDKTAG